LRLFKEIFRKFETFIKTTRLFEDIFKEMEASMRNLDFFKGYKAFMKKFSIE
jgi:hypothetical protein